jgi:bifunctional non-homologous end joining protein LigD
MPQGIEPSNLSKVFWPDQGLTKGDLLAYFDSVAPIILSALRDRPLTVKRYPDGIKGQTFFQKNTPSYAPSWVKTETIRAESAGRDVRYTLCNSKRTLKWLANQAVIEFHPWLSRAGRLHRPDYLVFDVDPPEGAFDRAVQIALLMKEVLDEAGLASVAKTSGAKGVHVYVPIRRQYSFGEVRTLAARLADRAEERSGGEATIEVRRAKRNNRVFLDIGRNAGGAHIIAVYSPRARPGATVSFPVDWRDLPKVEPAEFTLQTVPDLLKRRGDRWKDLMPRPQSLERAFRAERTAQ